MKVLINQEEIHRGIARLASQLHERYGNEPLTIVAIMTGSLVMLADLIRGLEMPVRISLIRASSYRGGMTSGELTIEDSDMLDIRGREVLLIDDIFDTGKTLAEVTRRLERHQPQSLRTAVFLNKRGNSVVNQAPDYSVFDIPNEFVVGYGLDYDDLYRNLPYVGVLEEADLAAHQRLHGPSK
jgi:hypoxanthine phosphoribosyltransferase